MGKRFISAKPTTKKNCRRQFFFGVGEALLPSSAKKIIDRVPKQEPPYAIKIGVFRRHISLDFQQWVTHKGNYRPRSKTVTQLSASKFFGRKSKKSLPRPFLDVILCGEFDSDLEMGLRSLPMCQIWLFQMTLICSPRYESKKNLENTCG